MSPEVLRRRTLKTYDEEIEDAVYDDDAHDDPDGKNLGACYADSRKEDADAAFEDCCA